MATIQEVAQHAGVSVGSVSNYLNGQKLRAQNAEKIKQAIEELGYQENFFAKSLKANHSMTLGLLVHNLQSQFSAGVVGAIEKVCDEHDYGLLITSHNGDPVRAQAKVAFLESRGVDGLITFETEDHWLTTKKNIGVSIVNPAQQLFPSVLTNERESVAQVITKMIAVGHRKIGIIASPQSDYTAQERLKGYYDAMAQAELPVASTWVGFGDYSRQSGFQEMTKLLAAGVTAVFVCNYNMSLGALRAIREADIPIGTELSYASFGYFDASELFTPKLTIIRQPLNEMGRQATLMVLAQLKGEQPVTVTLQNDILWQESIQPI